MLFSSFAHRLLLFFGVIFLATLVLVATALGLLGETASALLREYSDPLRRFYWEQKELIDPALKWAGFLVSLYGAVWTVHKSWHYAERNLPTRLIELNTRWKDAAIRERSDIIPALSEIATIATPPATYPGAIYRVLLWIHDGEQKALLRWSQKLDKQEAELNVLSSSRSRCRAEVVTAQLAVGSRLARIAPDRGQGALDAYKKALGFNSTDLDALELSAKQAFAMGFERPALKYLSELATAATKARDNIRQARALRFQAEILYQRANKTAWDDARAKLAGLITLLTNAADRHPDERNCELAFVHELLVDVQIKRERFTAAETALGEAKRLFATAPQRCGSEAQERLKALSERLIKARKDKDNPDVKD